jgi:hypothetical protein
VRHHAWLEANRCLDDDGLLWLVQPDESGLDASPQFDAVWGHRAHGQIGFPSLVRRNRRFGYDLRRIVAAGGPACCEPMTNVLYSLSRSALGMPSLTSALVARLWDPASGVFRCLARPSGRWSPSVTWAGLAPLALPDLPEEIGHRLVREWLLAEERFWLPVAPPSVSADDPAFSRGDRVGLVLRQRRYWRGPTWVNSAWLVWLGLVRLGYASQAAELVSRIAAAVDSSGLCEYYDPFDGHGLGQEGFGWSSLIMEMIEPDPRAVSSYLVG